LQAARRAANVTGEQERAPSGLIDLVREAWRVGKSIDLSGIGYGRIHWANFTDIVNEPFGYYHFLAGFVRCARCSRIIEIGTHQGGSARAMKAGLAFPERSRIVTFDVTPDGAEMLAADRVIHAITMDANTEAGMDASIEALGGRAPDLVYIDAVHYAWPSLQNFWIYGVGLAARYVIFDDIYANESMKKLWAYIGSRYPGNAVDAAGIELEIRQDQGFGLLRLRG
jgi:hypothetical protein